MGVYKDLYNYFPNLFPLNEYLFYSLPTGIISSCPQTLKKALV